MSLQTRLSALITAIGADIKALNTAVATKPRVVRGRVSNGGSRAGGTGFTVVKIGTGEYRVTFDSAFPAVPVVVGSPDLGGPVNQKTWQHDTEAATASAFRCSVRNSNTGAVVDVGFHFTATEA